MEKKKNVFALLQGMVLSLAVDVGLQLLLALLVVRGLLPESGILAGQGAACGLAALTGGWHAARKSGLGYMIGALTSTGGFLALLLLLGFLIFNGLAWNTSGITLLICGLAGGVFAGLLGGRRKTHRKNSRKREVRRPSKK